MINTHHLLQADCFDRGASVERSVWVSLPWKWTACCYEVCMGVFATRVNSMLLWSVCGCLCHESEQHAVMKCVCGCLCHESEQHAVMKCVWVSLPWKWTACCYEVCVFAMRVNSMLLIDTNLWEWHACWCTITCAPELSAAQTHHAQQMMSS